MERGDVWGGWRQKNEVSAIKIHVKPASSDPPGRLQGKVESGHLGGGWWGHLGGAKASDFTLQANIRRGSAVGGVACVG